MEIPFSPAEEIEIGFAVTQHNAVLTIPETRVGFLRRIILHTVINPSRDNRLAALRDRQLKQVANLPPEADAELEALILKYTGSVVTTRTR